MSTFCSNILLPNPYKIKVPCLDPKTSLEKEDMAPIFLPHLVFSSLSEHHPQVCHDLFNLGKGNLEKFWKGVADSGDDKLVDHPMCLEKHWQSRAVPLFIHGDGVEYHNRDTLLVFSWGCILGQKNSLNQHWLLASFQKAAL